MTLKPWNNFTDACRTEKTKKEYIAGLRLFMIHYRIAPELQKLSIEDSIPIMKDSCQEILKLTETELEDTIIDWLKYMKPKFSGQTVGTRLAGVRMFLVTNRIRLNWEYINQFKGSTKRKFKDLASYIPLVRTLGSN